MFKPVLAALVLFALPLACVAAASAAVPAGVAPTEAPGHSESATHEGHGLPQAPPVAFELRGFPVTNSMLVTWVVAGFLILVAQLATRHLKAVPEGLQNFWEWLVEGLYGFLEGIIGSDLVKKTFWFFATIFIFILACNWLGLIPGVGTIGWGTPDAAGHLRHISRPLLRGANADLNMTLAMSLIFFVMWTVWAIQANGVGGFLLHIFGPKGETTGLLKVLMVLIFIVAGVLEVVTILFRPVTLSFRLYGNVFAGENMLEAMANLVPALSWLIPIPFYFLEVLVGLVQALVFMLLTAVFTLLICTHDEGHGHEKAHA